MYDFPETRRDQTVDMYHGKSIADPYRWLEDDNSAETKAWVSAQNCVTEEYLAMVPERGRWRKRLAELWNFEKFGLPKKHGPYYFSFYNSGLWNQPALYISPSYADRGRLLLDPNNLSSDGTISLSAIAPSPDGKLLAYAQAEAGSDWVVWKILDTASGKEVPDQIRWCKNGSVAWLGDGSGFFYSRFAEPAADAELTALNKGQSVWLHRMGSNQTADTLVYERPDQSEWYLYPATSDDHKWLIIYASPGCNPETGIFIKDLSTDDSPVEPFLADFDAAWQVIDSTEERWILLTNQAAGRQRLLSIAPGNSDRSQWQELVAEDPDGRVLDAAHCCGQSILALYMTDARSELRVFDRSGGNMRKVELPGIGTISESCGQRESNEAFILFSSFARPSSLYRFDGSSSALSLASAPSLAFKPDDFVTSQVFYPSKDGTSIPLFIAHRRGLQIHKDTPALLYGYGGFNIPVRPRFEPTEMAWMDQGGLVALACLRGGGEYGLDWYNAGRLANKQNVFDDFIAAAEWLIAEGYTSRSKLAINGRSNGGLLVGACLTQRPDLFGAAVPEVGVMDMLRYHKFTLGWGWTSDYGCSDTPEGYTIVIQYSPLHNIKTDRHYPPTMVMTCDHDDRVIPAHSHKFTATLQSAQKAAGGSAPILTRITTSAGHGAGMPTEKRIEERADLLSFLTAALNLKLAEQP